MDTLTGELLSKIGGTRANDLNELVSIIDDVTERNNLISESPYYELDDLKATLHFDERQFNVLSLNIQGIRTKFDEFCAFLEYLQERNVYFSAICIQETGLKEDADTNPFKIPGFKLIPQGKSASEKGGLIIYLKDNYNYTVRHKYNISKLSKNV